MSIKSVFLVIFVTFAAIAAVFAWALVYRGRIAPDIAVPAVSSPAAGKTQDGSARPIGGETEQKIREILAAKYEKAVSDVSVTITKSDGMHAAGGVKFAMRGEFGAGGAFLAVKTDQGWKVVYDGNGSIDCIAMKQTYRFPADMLTGFCD